MATLKLHCKRCDKPMKLKYEAPFGKKFIRSYTCGHSEFTDKSVNDISQADIDLINASVADPFELDRFNDDGGANSQFVKPFIHESFWALATCEPFFCDECQEIHARHHAYEFQRTGVEFSEDANHNCCIADAMGLGKTIQALLAVRRSVEKLSPVVYVVKGSTQLQWCHQLKYWLDDSPLGVMPVISRETIIPGFKHYVISIDFIARKGVMDRLLALKAQCIVVDECQNIKNSSSDRTKTIIDWIQKCEIPHKIFLSGTPIKNRASEYFTILNLIDPARFYSFAAFCKHWLIPNEKGIYTRIDPHMLEAFHEITGDYIIRREKRDVLKKLPKTSRDFQYMVIEDPRIKNAYNNELDLFANFRKTAGKMNSTVLLGWLAKMRAITGQAKVPWAIDYAKDFLDNTEDPLLIGIQHQSVRDTLYFAMKAKGYDPLKFSGEDNIYAKERAKQAFIEKRNRLMIMNMLAGGVGVDGLQKVCWDAVILERQWNAADEEQFESRLDRDGQLMPTNFLYPIAKGTIDEWFHDGVIVKRKICAETLGDDFVAEKDEDFLNDLVNKTLENRL